MPMAEMRAGRLKEDLLALVALGEDRASLIMAALPHRDLRRIEQAAPGDWLPIELMVSLCRAVHAVAGDAGVHAWRRAALRRSFESSLFRPILDATVRMLGLTPAALLRLVPVFWGSSYREAGHVAVELSPPQAAAVRLIALPEPMRERAVLVSLAGGLEAFLETVGCTGEVRLVEPVEGDVVITASWRTG
jgi:hypothetical protein